MTETVITRDALSEALDKLAALDSPHVDIGPMLGLEKPLRVGFDDLHSLLQSGAPSFSVEYGDTSVAIKVDGGGHMLTVSGSFQ